MTVTIFHNPRCGTSRSVLETIRANGVEPTVVEYLREPLSRERLIGLVAATGGSARALLREKEPLCAKLGLSDAATADDDLIDAMVANPILINRPIVETARGTLLCRPAERVLGLLDALKP